MLDHRFRSFLDTSIANERHETQKLDKLRKERDGDSGGNEVAIARAEGAKETWSWITTELKRLDKDMPAAPGAKPPKSDDASVRSQIQYALNAANTAMIYGRDCGWADAKYPVQECINYIEAVKAHLGEQ